MAPKKPTQSPLGAATVTATPSKPSYEDTRFHIPPVRQSLQTGRPIAVNPDDRDIRLNKTFGMK
jgi:hypothetical protein